MGTLKGAPCIPPIYPLYTQDKLRVHGRPVVPSQDRPRGCSFEGGTAKPPPGLGLMFIGFIGFAKGGRGLLSTRSVMACLNYAAILLAIICKYVCNNIYIYMYIKYTYS